MGLVQVHSRREKNHVSCPTKQGFAVQQSFSSVTKPTLKSNACLSKEKINNMLFILSHCGIWCLYAVKHLVDPDVLHLPLLSMSPLQMGIWQSSVWEEMLSMCTKLQSHLSSRCDYRVTHVGIYKVVNDSPPPPYYSMSNKQLNTMGGWVITSS